MGPSLEIPTTRKIIIRITTPPPIRIHFFIIHSPSLFTNWKIAISIGIENYDGDLILAQINITGLFGCQPYMNSKDHHSLKAVLALAMALLDFQDIILIFRFQLP
jgi:hypothetical protein